MTNKTKFLFLYALIAVAIAGCGGTKTMKVFKEAAPASIRTFSLAPQEGNSEEVNYYIAEAMRANGAVALPPVQADVRLSNEADAIVTYADVWRFGLYPFQKSISISFYNAKNGELMALGSWKTDHMNTWGRGHSESRMLVDEIFAKTYGGDASPPK